MSLDEIIENFISSIYEFLAGIFAFLSNLFQGFIPMQEEEMP